MWRTSCGVRVLEGAEAAVFRFGLSCLRDMLIVDEDFEYECAPFDRLTLGQKLSVLCEVAAALLDPKVPPPELTATNEGAIAVVYSHLGVVIECDEEIPDAEDSLKLVEEACRELQLPEIEELRPSGRLDVEEMWFAIDALRDRILWDADYADEDLYIDLAPQDSAKLHDFARTTRDYFLDIPPDPPESEMKALLQRLDKFVSR